MADEDLSIAGVKRKGESICVGPKLTPASSPSISPTAKRQILESVALPSRRSKLGTDKTTSLDNLTLASSRVKTEPNDVKNEAVKNEAAETLSGDTTEEEIPMQISRRGRTRATRTSVQKHTYKEEDSDSEEDVKPTRAARSGASKGKGRAKANPFSDDDFSDAKDADYAMNSDDEINQIDQAIKASRTSNGKASTSSSASTTPSRSGRKSRVQANVLGGTPTKGDAPRRAAISRAAERESNHLSHLTTVRARASRATTGETTGSSFGSPVSDSTPGPQPDDDYSDDLTDLSDSVSAFSSDDSDEEDFKAPVAIKAPRKKKAKGRRLDGEEGEEMPDHWVKPKMSEEDEAERERQKQEKLWIKSKEKALVKKLGRKLGQSEKNHIRLCLVSH